MFKLFNGRNTSGGTVDRVLRGPERTRVFAKHRGRWLMLLSVLLDPEGMLVAAAAACDQQPWGQRYWKEVQGLPEALNAGWETAHLEVDDPLAAEELLLVQPPPKSAADAVVAALLTSPSLTGLSPGKTRLVAPG